MRRGLLAVVLALALVTAGCNRFVGGGQETPTAESSPSVAPADLPPGVSADGLENLSALLAVQGEALNETGYVASARTNLSLRVDGGLYANQQTNSTATYEAGGAAVYERWVIDRSQRPPRTRLTWTNRSVGVTKTVTGELGSDEE
jgi:hypothetical protein